MDIKDPESTVSKAKVNKDKRRFVNADFFSLKMFLFPGYSITWKLSKESNKLD